MSYVVLEACWCNIIFLNMHTPSDEKSDDSKTVYIGELEQVVYHFLKYHMKILLGDVKAKLGRQVVFKPTTGNNKDNGVRIVNFATSKYLVIKSTMFPH